MSEPSPSVYDRIYLLVGQVPTGEVATYGQLAKIEGHCGPRQVGYALAALGRMPDVRDRWPDLPWQRVVNSRGMLSPRSDGEPIEQAQLLRAEGVRVDARGRIDMAQHQWQGPDLVWLLENDFEPPGNL